ncbi:hypothetical protein [Sphingomonas sp. BK069]|uniref:hypothetical protein n=1 Tax=Sphingomonas sp. BK069 TaxID=2586979 RepID=UPI0016161B06|nr:hypothetical protein [Sphingomonas sp. BK069]MBB3350000.1 hypothetical protein [Sphingomonas sp. BK069]
MERYLLFIRDDDGHDQTDIHPSESSAREALADYVRSRTKCRGSVTVLLDDDAIDQYFAGRDAHFLIARLAKTMRREGDPA